LRRGRDPEAFGGTMTREELTVGLMFAASFALLLFAVTAGF
jgi:hypothetical protein